MAVSRCESVFMLYTSYQSASSMCARLPHWPSSKYFLQKKKKFKPRSACRNCHQPRGSLCRRSSKKKKHKTSFTDDARFWYTHMCLTWYATLYIWRDSENLLYARYMNANFVCEFSICWDRLMFIIAYYTAKFLHFFKCCRGVCQSFINILFY